MRTFVVEVWHCKRRPALADYYLVFAENADKAMEKAKNDCASEPGDKLCVTQEIEQGKTTFLYDELDAQE